jgi:hypothetical protein
MSKRFSAQFKQEAVQLVSAERPISEVARQSASIKKCKESVFARCNGGAEEDRTPDLRIANATLSQLSYRPNDARSQTIQENFIAAQARLCAQ